MNISASTYFSEHLHIGFAFDLYFPKLLHIGSAFGLYSKHLHICFAFGLYFSEHLHTLLVLPLITYRTPRKPLLLGEAFFSFCLWFVVDVYEVFRRFQKTICVECWMDQ